MSGKSMVLNDHTTYLDSEDDITDIVNYLTSTLKYQFYINSMSSIESGSKARCTLWRRMDYCGARVQTCARPGGDTLDPELNSAASILQLITGRCAAGRQRRPSPAQM